ncbi:MAG TPA: ABC transporter permease [Thermoleophilaceae bacterium]
MTTQAAHFGRPIKGPSALSGGRGRLLSLTWTLAFTDFKLKFFGSVLGYLWQLVRPLLLFGVLYVVFTHVVRLGSDVQFYPVVLLTGIVLYTFVAEATGGCVSAVVDREGLVRKIQFPRIVIPLSVIVTAYLNLALNLIAVFIFAIASGVDIRWSWLELPFLLAFLGVFATGIGMALSALYVRYRDVRPIWEVGLQLLFYASPVIYPVEKLPNATDQHLAMCNPLAAVIQQVRHSVIDPTAPSAAQAIGGAPRLLIPIAITFGLFVLGFWIFNREAPRIAEEL